ncbi:MAG: hypothetical protein C4336_08375 [Armatimonadota bacterium]
MVTPSPFPKLEEVQSRPVPSCLPTELSPLCDAKQPIHPHTAEPAPAVFPEVKPPPTEPSPPDLTAFTRKANEIVRSAYAQAEQIHQQAYQQGYTAGMQEATTTAQNALQLQIENLRQEVNQFLQQLQHEFDTYIQSTEAHMVELVMEIARKVIREELRVHPDHVVAIVRDALRRIKGVGTVRVVVHPADLERVRQNRIHLLTVLEGVERLEIVEDRRVEAGSCRIETEQGTYDARLSTQLELIEHALRQAG